MITTINEFKKHLKIRSINEGQFSWFTQDRHTQIGNMDENRIPVYMFDNKGNFWFEDNYQGYGKFGGKDYYDLVAEMNGYTLEDVEALGKHKLRSIGIDLSFNNLEPKNGGKKLFPALVEDIQFDWKNHDFTQEPDNDPNQGWLIDYDEDEEQYYDDYDYDNLEESKINENIYNITKIGKINKEIEIEIDLEHTAHSMERQGRSNTYIKNSDIKETVDMATEEIFDALVTDKLNVGDRMCIKNTDTDLNVVGSIIANKKDDGVIFKVITVMIHKEFRNVAGTYEIHVSKNK